MKLAFFVPLFCSNEGIFGAFLGAYKTALDVFGRPFCVGRLEYFELTQKAEENSLLIVVFGKAVIESGGFLH